MTSRSYGITMRSKSFQTFIDWKIEDLEYWKNNPSEHCPKLVGYVLDINDKAETITLDLIIQPVEPVPFFTLNFEAVKTNVSFNEVIKKDF